MTASASALSATGNGLAEERPRFRPSKRGIAARATVALLLAAAVVVLPTFTPDIWDTHIALAAIYGLIGLSVNVITGHGGQISLGHQAFVGIGAFMSAFVAARLGAAPFDPAIGTPNFFVAVIGAAITGAVMALFLGLAALRIRGLYLALVTLAFGIMAENSLFNWGPFTGGGAGATAPRPAAFASDQAYAYACLAALGLFLLVDWRLTSTKAGRAIVALRNNDQVAATLGINVTGYKLLAFITGGLLAGVAGALFAHLNEFVQAQDFILEIALVWVLMAVVGGLGSRAGVVIGSTVFAIFPFLFPASTINVPFFGDILVPTLVPFAGALLLLLTLTLFPGGIGQQLIPIRRWMAGGPLVVSRHEATQMAGLPGLVAGLVAYLLMSGPWWLRLVVAVGALAAAAVTMVGLLSLYLRAVHAAQRAGRPRQRPGTGARMAADAVRPEAPQPSTATPEGHDPQTQAVTNGGAAGSPMRRRE